MQDAGETDVDCGGPNCLRCVPGRACLDDSDCDDASSKSNWALAPSSRMVVCAAGWLRCVDRHVAADAYSGGSGAITPLAASLALWQLPPCRFTRTAFKAVQGGLSTALAGAGIAISADRVMAVSVNAMDEQRRRLTVGGAPAGIPAPRGTSCNLTVWLLFDSSQLASAAAAVFNADQAAVIDGVSSALLLAGAENLTVSVLSPAASGALLPALASVDASSQDVPAATGRRSVMAVGVASAAGALALVLGVAIIAFYAVRRRGRPPLVHKQPEPHATLIFVVPVEPDSPPATTRSSLFFKETCAPADTAPTCAIGDTASTHNPMRVEAHRHAFAPTASRPHSHGLISPPAQDEQ